MTLEDVAALKRVTVARISPAGDQIAYLLQVPRKLWEDDDGEPHHESHMTDLHGISAPFVTGRRHRKPR